MSQTTLSIDGKAVSGTESSGGIERTGNLDAELELLLTSFDTSYAWNYGSVKEGLRDLYEKAKREQWNGTMALRWDTDVDPEGEIIPAVVNPLQDYAPYRKLDGKEKARFRHAQISLQLSQFMHGEQGALLAASQLVSAVPWMEAKYYAATQTMDEARHVAFGVISLKGYYDDMPEKERREREDFVIEVCQLMRDRLIGNDIARAFGWNPDEVRRIVLASPVMQQFRELLFMRVVPNVKKLGLLGPRVRKAFSDLHIIQFEDVDSDALDRRLGLL